MNMRLGIYEIFSRIVPGGFYLAAIVQFLVVVGLLEIDWQMITDVSLLASLILIAVCYILGEALDRFALAWFRLFKRPGFSARTFEQFRKTYADRWKFDFKEFDWPILLAFLRTKNLELAGQIERHNALSIMLRNVSLGLLIMAVNSLIAFLLSQNAFQISMAAILLLLSILIIMESIKFRGWFYGTIYETMLAYRINPEDSIQPVHASPKRSRAKRESEE